MGADSASFISGPTLRRSAPRKMPLRKGEVIDHCDPMDFGSPERRRLGHHLFSGYPIGKGPFTLGRRRVRSLIWAVSGFPWRPAFQIFDSRLNQVKSAVYAGRVCGDFSPRPHLLDAGDDGLLYLAVARRSNRKIFFRTDRLADPPAIYTYAQIEIYNATNPEHQPDAYTQNWRARLAPASLIASPLAGPVPRHDALIADFARLFLEPGSPGAAQLARVGHH